MADTLPARRSGLTWPAPVPDAPAILGEGAPVARFVLRADATAARAVGEAFALALPERINMAATTADRSALKLGPDEWLLLAGDAADPRAAQALAEALQGAAAGSFVSVVDVSHRQLALTLSGPGAADILSYGVPLDLRPAAFPVGMATRTLGEKAEIVLWRQAEQQFHVEVARSFAPSVVDWLVAALAERAAS